jgi:hypothetical protein
MNLFKLDLSLNEVKYHEYKRPSWYLLIIAFVNKLYSFVHIEYGLIVFI